MKPHMIAFGAAAFDASAGLVTVPFITDPVIRAASNIVQLTDDWNLLYGYAGGVNLARLRLNSASLRTRGFPNLFPFMNAVLAGDNPAVFDFRDYPHLLRNGENISLQATTAAAVDVIAVLQICRGEPNYNINTRGLRWVRFTASLTSVAFTWGPEANVTLDDDMESGEYDVYGFTVFEADAIAARLVFKDQVERPGCISQQTAVQRPWPGLGGGIGKLGRFSTITPPMIQSMHVASAAQSLVGQMLIGKAA